MRFNSSAYVCLTVLYFKSRFIFIADYNWKDYYIC